MAKERFKTCVSSYLILRDKEKVLLSLRGNTGYKDGYWGLVSGHVEKGESAKTAARTSLLQQGRVGQHFPIIFFNSF